MKKYLAVIGLLDYSLGMETTTPTAAPSLKAAYTAVHLDTITKTNDGKVITCYFAKEQITCDYGYNTIKTFEVGDQIIGQYNKDGLAQVDGYNCLVCKIIPWDKIITREFITVRETKVTTWEIVNK